MRIIKAVLFEKSNVWDAEVQGDVRLLLQHGAPHFVFLERKALEHFLGSEAVTAQHVKGVIEMLEQKRSMMHRWSNVSLFTGYLDSVHMYLTDLLTVLTEEKYADTASKQEN